ncbi:hypothetical protein [Streptomyces viridochromogenes]|uniref:hypothetical protein n=1 Tax=Streptomyces viridochromogenes TaxID=1938 RepID=UPI00069DA371|nr:hypothetical protein [Streptomyces viridochromogenes]KOG14678.1 membrane protein [Streptomyces viridochromogenes]KOG24153.1 membrane protein [Streptomyces viridochromogenes]
MFLSRSGSDSPSFLRGRIALLLLLVAVGGSPWAQQPVWDFYVEKFYIELSGDETLRTLTEAALVPGWGYSLDRYGSVTFLVIDNVCVVALLAGLALFASRLLRHEAGWIRCLAVGVLAAEVEALLRVGLLKTFGSDVPVSPTDTLLKDLTLSALVFGLALGVLLALLTARPPGTRAPRSVAAQRTAPARRRKGGFGMTTPQVRMPVGSTPGDVTRYLCTAAYVDERFADRVVEEVLADEASAVAPSPDVDLVSVARHCLTAQELRHQRDLRLAGAFAVVALLAPLWLVYVAMLLSTTRRPGAQPSLATRGHHQPGSKALVAGAITAGVVSLLAFYFASLVSSLPVPGFAGWLLGAYLGGVPAVLASIGAVVFAHMTVVDHDRDIDQLLRTTMTRDTFAQQPRPTVPRRQWMAERFAALRQAQVGNVTVYSGYTPFVGYSETRSKWSLAVPLLPADDKVGMTARPAGPEPFTVAELVDHVRARLRAVAERGVTEGAAEAGEEALGSLVIEDRVFVNGTTIGDDERFIEAERSITPTVRLSPEEVERIMLRPTGTVRHYLAVHVPMWGGDVVPSVFLHFSTAGRTLHLHCDNHVLGPVAADYHVVDRLRGPLGPEGRRGLLLASLARTGGAFFAAPYRAWRHARFETRRTRRMVDELKAMEQDPVFDYGARVSIREMALSPEYHNYFQVVDSGRIVSLVERHTLAAIREFLDAHGYDITDFRTQQQTILNQGLIQQGGMSIIGNQAIGAGATATQNIPQQSGASALSAAGGSDK